MEEGKDANILSYVLLNPFGKGRILEFLKR